MQNTASKKNDFSHFLRTSKSLLITFAFALLITITLALCISSPALAQTVTLDLGEESGSTTGRIIQLLLLTTVITLAPSILVMTTSFTRIIIVFSIMRHALSTNTSPPNSVIVSLSLFMTFFIMQPTFEKAWDTGIAPLMENQLEEKQAIALAAEPFHEFMMNNVRSKDLELFMGFVEANDEDIKPTGKNKTLTASDIEKDNKDGKEKDIKADSSDIPYRALIPAFMISELRRAFEIGFLIYIPFVIVDMVIASILMSMGMMMLPPTMLAMPFKLIFFVLVDGWYLLTGSLIQSFN
ncbi:MAG: flagellar biosynthetic protein FliP [Alphaproteobacteria bacterium]|nr:flagellar biosynthetic protein FliP [Alphaproteobacteria bacterium]